MLTPLARRTYAPRGQTPIQYCWDRRDRISAISAITVSPILGRLGLQARLLPDNHNVRSQDTVMFLRMLKRHLHRPLTIIWDRSRVHDRCRAVQRYLDQHPEIVTEPLPAYAPELNPDEGVWRHTKYARMANYAPPDTRALRRRLRCELKRLRRQPHHLAAFIEHTGLPLRL